MKFTVKYTRIHTINIIAQLDELFLAKNLRCWLCAV